MKQLSTTQFVVLILFFMADACWGQTFVIEKETKTPYNLTSTVSKFNDSSAKLSFEQIKNKSFTKNTANQILLPFANQATWLKIDLKNNTSTDTIFYFFIDNPLIKKATLYANNQDDSLMFEPFKYREISKLKSPNFQIKLRQGESKNFYFKLESQRGIYIVLQLYDAKRFEKFNITSRIGFGFMIGLTWMLIFIVFTVGFIVIKDSKSKSYAVYTFLRTIGFWASTNVLGAVISADSMVAEKITFALMGINPIISASLALSILPFDKLPRWIKIGIYGLTATNVLLLVYFFEFYGPIPIKLLIIFTVICHLFFYIIFIFTLVKKTNQYPFYAIPFLLGNAANLFMNLRVLGIINFDFILQLTTLLAVVEIAVYVYYLSHIFRISVKRQAEKLKNLGFEAEKAIKLEELDKLKTRFFTNISHEFRTPLTLLVGPIDDLKQKYPQEGIISVIQRNLQRLQTLINQLLELSKLEAGETKINYQEIDIALFLGQLFASFESLAQSKNILFNHSQSHSTLLGLADVDKLEKIISNLLSNAFKFTPEFGRVSVRVTVQAPPALEGGAKKADLNSPFGGWGANSGAAVLITVQDSGIGIEESRLAYIFDRFYQVDDGVRRLQEGTGIGLALVKELVEVLNGKIEVRSQVGEGTTFELTVPYMPLETLSISATNIVPKQEINVDFEVFRNMASLLQEGQAIMLIVEDNADLRNYIASIFEKKYQIITAKDGLEGLEKAIEFVPDVVISDLMMPKLDGLGFCEKLKNDERINHIPVVMLTAKATIADKLIGLEKGADDYLPKPFNKDELTLRVSNLIAQRQLMREKYQAQTSTVIAPIEVPKEPTIDELFIQKAKKVIDKHLDKSGFDVEEFADNMNLSSVQLRRKIKALTDQTVTEFVRNYRLEIAATMLKKGEGSVSEIAYRVGFESLPYFSKVFQEKYGKTASEWR